jgi:hypothetical protein
MKLQTPNPRWFRKNDDDKIGKSSKEMRSDNWDKAMSGKLKDKDITDEIKKGWEE